MPTKRSRKTNAIPDPAREAMRQSVAADRQRREAEFAARADEWSQQADAWFADWSREEELKEHAERRVRLEAERAKLEAERAKLEAETKSRERAERRARKKAEEAERPAREAKERAEKKARRKREKAEREAKDDYSEQRSQQFERDRAYVDYLRGLGAWLEMLEALNEQLLGMRNPNYGAGDHKRFYNHTPPPPRFFTFVVPGPCPFAVLGIPPGSTKDEIKRAYYQLAKKHHPDQGGEETEFRRINEAYSACLKAIGAG